MIEVPDTYKVEIGGLGKQTTPLSMLALAEVRDVYRTLQCGPRRATVVDLWVVMVSPLDGRDGHAIISVPSETLPTATVSLLSSLQPVYATEFNSGQRRKCLRPKLL